MNYLKSEHLKFKRTISNKLLFIIPLMTAVFAWIAGGFTGFQYTALYWWYAFLLPGAVAILCSLSHRKEENAPDRHKNMLAKLMYLYGSGIFALFFLFLLFVIGIHLLEITDTVPLGTLMGAAAGIAFCNLIICIFHLFLSFKFGLGLSLFWGVFESLQGILYSNIERKGITGYIPFSWSMNWVRDILSRQIFSYGTEKIWIAALTAGGLLLILLWFSHWEGRKNYE